MALLKANTGIGTTNPTSALHVFGDGLVTGVVTATTFSGQINSGVGTFTNLTATNATLTNINSSGITTLGVTTVTRLTAQSINSSGIVTGSTFRPSSGYIQSPNGTNAFYIYDGTGNVAFQGTIGASQVNNASGFKVIGFAGTDITFENNARIAGVTTSVGGFVGNLTGTATTATKLQNARTFEITGDILASPISFDGTGNVSLAATIQPNSVALGSDTTGDYVQSVSGTASQITVTGGTGEGSTPVIAIANNATLPGNVTIANDLQVNNNLNVTGNITIGGTAAYVIVNDFRIKDADIVLGFTTDAYGNDVSNDTTANHGGISVASTVGNPLVQIFNPGIGESTLPTYKKIMWFESGAFAGLNTDAWLINYAVGIGSTQFPSGTRLAAGSVQFTERDLAVVRNINASGIVTAVQFIGTASTASFATTAYNLTDAANITTGTINPARLSGTYNINISGNAATATYATSAGVATYASSAGIATYATNAGVATYATSAGVATYASNAGVATYANAAGIATNVIGGIASVTQLLVSGISALGIVTATQLYVSGVTTSVGGFVGNLTGTASTASFATTSSYLSDANNILSGTINVARLTGTYDININGNATTANYATNAGIATYASAAGIATYATSSGIATSANTLSGIPESDLKVAFATTAGVSTSVIGGIASVTQLFVSGVSTLGTVQVSSGIITSTSGIVTYYGDGSKLQGIVSVSGISVQDEGSTVGTSVTTLNFSGATISVSSAVGGISTVTVVESGIATYANVAGIATYASNAGVATYANVAGIATYASNAGVATYASNAGVATYASNAGVATYANVAGIATYANVAGIATYASNAGVATYANVAGIATYASNAGVSTNVIGGIASVTQLSVSGVSTFNDNVFVGTGITMYASTGIISATAFYGSGFNLTDLIQTINVSKIDGITVQDEGNTVGTAASITKINFVGDYVTATGIGSTATITFTTPPYADISGIATYSSTAGIATYATNAGVATYASVSGISTNVIGGIASVTQLSVSGITTLGVTSSTNLTSQQLNVSGVSTIGNFSITPVGSGATVGGIGVTYFGDGSQLTGISAAGGVSISNNTTNQNQFLTYAVSTGSTTGLGVTSNLVFNPSTTRLGIGTTNPIRNLQVIGDASISSNVGVGTTNPTVGVTSANTAVLAAGIVTAYKLYGDGSEITGILKILTIGVRVGAAMTINLTTSSFNVVGRSGNIVINV